jgi:hypothetical protein
MSIVQATGEALDLKKRASSTSKLKFLSVFPLIVGHFRPPGAGIRIQSTKIIYRICLRIRIEVQIQKL